MQHKIRCSHRRQTSPRCCLLANWTKHMSSLILAHSVHYVKHDVIHKTGSTEHIALSSEKDRATDNMYRKFDEIWTCDYLRYTNEQTDRQAHRHADYNTSHPYRRRSNEYFFPRRLCFSINLILRIGLPCADCDICVWYLCNTHDAIQELIRR